LLFKIALSTAGVKYSVQGNFYYISNWIYANGEQSSV